MKNTVVFSVVTEASFEPAYKWSRLSPWIYWLFWSL